MDSRYQVLPKRERTIRWLRWAGIFPAAVLASVVIQFIAEIGYGMAAPAPGAPAETTFVSYLLLLLFYVPKEAGFVVAGES